MKICTLPFFKENPYQSRLCGNVSALGVSVKTVPLKRRWLADVLDFNPDVVHFHWTHDLMLSHSWLRSLIKTEQFYTQLRQLRRRVPALIWTCHNLHNHKASYLWLEKFALRRSVRLFDRIIVHHDSAVDQVIEQFGLSDCREKITIIEHANFINDYPTFFDRESARQQLGLPKDEVILLMFGQLRASKGIDRLISAFKRLNLLESRIRLLLVGSASGEFRANLEALSKSDSRIDLRMGYVENEMVQAYHAAADIAVLPYRSGLTSGALVLSMGFSLPIVCADCGDARRDIAGRGGIVLEDASDRALHEALVQILEEPAAWEVMGQHNFESVLRQDWSTMAKQTLSCYESVLADSANGPEQA